MLLLWPIGGKEWPVWKKPQRERLSLIHCGAGRGAAFGAASDELAACVRGGAEIVAAVGAVAGESETAKAGPAAVEEREAGERPGGGGQKEEPAGAPDAMAYIRVPELFTCEELPMKRTKWMPRILAGQSELQWRVIRVPPIALPLRVGNDVPNRIALGFIVVVGHFNEPVQDADVETSCISSISSHRIACESDVPEVSITPRPKNQRPQRNGEQHPFNNPQNSPHDPPHGCSALFGRLMFDV